MRQSMYRSDVFRLVHGRDFWISIAGVVAIVLFSNLSEIPKTLEFVAVDYLMDNFLYGGWYRNLLFVVAAYPFARSYCQDAAYGFRDTAIQKTGVFRYVWSKAWCTAASAFFVTFSGLFISAGIFRLFCEPCYYETFGEMNYTYPYGTLAAGGNTILFLAVRFLLFSLGAAPVMGFYDPVRSHSVEICLFFAGFLVKFSTFGSVL
ncbi:MAG: hypothetical protein NC307_11085 [Roseburia sp.]|nr:hypothetical protein [Roseburia sp.]